MKNEHVLSGLIAKRAELAGKVETLQREMRETVLAIDHIDAAIRMFDPDADSTTSNLDCRHGNRLSEAKSRGWSQCIAQVREGDDGIRTSSTRLGWTWPRGRRQAFPAGTRPARSRLPSPSAQEGAGQTHARHRRAGRNVGDCKLSPPCGVIAESLPCRAVRIRRNQIASDTVFLRLYGPGGANRERKVIFVLLLIDRPAEDRTVEVRQYLRLRFGRWETVRSHYRRPPR